MPKAYEVFGDMVWQKIFLIPLAFCIFLCWGARPREARPTFLWRFVSSDMTQMSEHVLKFSWLISHGGGGFWSPLKQHLPEVNKLIQILVNPDFANLRVIPVALCVNDTTVYKGFPLRKSLLTFLQASCIWFVYKQKTILQFHIFYSWRLTTSKRFC